MQRAASHRTTDPFGGRGASLSLDRCIDWLLDLHQSTDDRRLRVLISEVLDDLRAVAEHPSGLAGLGIDDIVLGALASVEAAFEIVGGVSRVG